jgi:hypothetical protein
MYASIETLLFWQTPDFSEDYCLELRFSRNYHYSNRSLTPQLATGNALAPGFMGAGHDDKGLYAPGFRAADVFIENIRGVVQDARNVQGDDIEATGIKQNTRLTTK